MKTRFGKKIGTGILAALIAASLIPAAADACQGRGGRGGGYGMDCGMMGGKGQGSALGIWQNPQAVEDLKLTPEQVGKLKEADFAAREKHQALRAEIDSLRLQMDQAFAADTVDENAVRQLSEKMAAVKGKMSVQRTETQLAVRKLLTPEQFSKLNMFRQNRPPCMGQGGNGMNGNRPCPMMNGQGGGQGMGMGQGKKNMQQ